MRLHASSMVLLLFLSLAAVPQAVRAQAPIFDFTDGGGSASSGGDSVYGFDFMVTGTQTITSLGFFDYKSDGLRNSHEVGLYDNVGNLLASTTIDNATSLPVASTGSGRYLARAINPVTLTSGTYVLAATYTSLDDQFGNAASISSTPGFAYGSERYINSTTTLTFPTNSDPTDTYPFGPMAFTGAAGAPEPGSFALVLMAGVPGVAFLGLQRRRRAYAAAI